MLNLTPSILLLPLLGFIALGLVGRALPRWLISWIGCGVVLAAFALATVNFASLLGTPQANRASFLTLGNGPWISAGPLIIRFDFLYDPLSAVMLLVVTGVGFLIHLYSVGYMEDDPGYWRFFSFLNLFVFAMTLLVAAGNFLLLLVGWAGVGLASFLLIGFWYTRPSAVAAAKKAFVVNVIGDFGLMIAIFLLFNRFGTLAYMGTGPRHPGILFTGPTLGGASPAAILPLNSPEVIAITLLLFVAAAAKSAQFPLHVWLPDAMEGPTPVSALIHAATMVTAGVYLVARAAPLFDRAPTSLAVVAGIGGFTALFAATIACVQTDIKRVLAYSTMSQLGYMFIGEGAGGYTSGIFHLTTHAYFKALLFMAAGAVIHALGGEQDMRKMGGLRQQMTVTFWSIICGGLALAAIVPFSGFWSKDSILSAVWQRALASGASVWYVLYASGLLTAALTGFYIFRLIFTVFLGSERAATLAPATPRPVGEGPGVRSAGAESPLPAHGEGPGERPLGWTMAVPIVALAALSLIGGVDGLPGHDAIGNLLAPVVGPPFGLEPGSAQFYVSIGLGLLFALAGIGVAWRYYGARQHAFAPSRNPGIQFLARGWYIDDVYSALIVRPVLWFSRLTARDVEGVALDDGSQGVAWLTARLSAGLRTLQTGYVRTYALGIVLGGVLILLYVVLRFGVGG
jgi:NADH-quinone oxidoreductase subunit L